MRFIRAASWVALAAVIGVGACTNSATARLEPAPSYTVHDGDNAIKGRFEAITLNGMPCIVWLASEGSTDARWGRGGLTCDWSKR